MGNSLAKVSQAGIAHPEEPIVLPSSTSEGSTKAKQELLAPIQRIYLVITEEFYGGENKIRIFTTKELAIKYAIKLGHEENLDVIIYEKTILSDNNMDDETVLIDSYTLVKDNSD